MTLLSRHIHSRVWILTLLVLLGAFCPPASTAYAKKKSQGPTPWLQHLVDLSALIAGGQYSQALELLQSTEIKKSETRLKNRLSFISAYLHFREGDYGKAAEEWKAMRGQYPLLQDYMDFYLALSLRESGKAKEAVEILKQLKQTTASPHLRNLTGRELALAYCKAQDRGTAIEMLNGLIQTESSEVRAYHLSYDRAQCLITLGQGQEAVASLKTLYLNYPEGDLSHDIRVTLEKIAGGQGLGPADHLQRANQLMQHGRPELAVLDFEKAREGYGSGAPPSLELNLAEAYFKAREYPKAAGAYEAIRSRYPESFGAEERLRLAQSYARSDQFDKAIRAYEEMSETCDPSEKPRLSYKIAFLHTDMGDYRKANGLFTKLLEDYPKHSERDQIYWFLAWNHYLLKDYGEALAYLDILEENFPASPPSLNDRGWRASPPSSNDQRWRASQRAGRVPYWRARILEKQGNSEQARLTYQRIADENKFSYYGFLSLKRLENNFDPARPPRNYWTRELPQLRVPAPFSINPMDSGGKTAVLRLKELLILGLWEDFLGELDYVTAGEGIGELEQLKYQASVDNGAVSDNPDDPWESSYPAAYATLVSLFSTSRNFPPPLTWAIMREESRFRPDALSPAQAMGLMQIIPPTGVAIARELGRKGFVPEQLYRPVVNIEYGVQYLNTNLKRFGGALPQTIASYNAGPDAVARWLKARPDREWDEFIEEIPYQETNRYVKKVLKSYYIYCLLYPN